MFASEIIIIWMSHAAGSNNIFPLHQFMLKLFTITVAQKKSSESNKESDLSNEKYLYSEGTRFLLSVVITKQTFDESTVLYFILL